MTLWPFDFDLHKTLRLFDSHLVVLFIGQDKTTTFAMPQPVREDREEKEEKAVRAFREDREDREDSAVSRFESNQRGVSVKLSFSLRPMFARAKR